MLISRLVARPTQGEISRQIPGGVAVFMQVRDPDLEPVVLQETPGSLPVTEPAQPRDPEGVLPPAPIAGGLPVRLQGM